MLIPEGEARRLDLLPDLGEALADVGEFAWAELFLQEAVDSDNSSCETLVSTKAELLLLYVKGQGGSPERWSEQLVGAAARAIARFEERGDDGALATAWRLLAWAHGTSLRFGRAADAAERAIEHARLVGDLRQKRRAASQYAVAALHGPTPVAEAIRRCEEIIADAGDDRRTEGLVRSLLAYLYGMRGNFPEARRLYTEARVMLEGLGRSVVAASTSLDAYGVEMLAGDLVAAERELRRDYAALTALGEKYLLSTVAGELARVLYGQGRYEEAEAMSRKAEELAAADDVGSQTLWRSARAKISARLGRHAEALRLAWEAVELIGRTDAHLTKAETLLDLAEVLRIAEREDEADAAMQEAAGLLEAKGSVVAAQRARALTGLAV
jgi:tetratricopeptide (TPR) repeat protein